MRDEKRGDHLAVVDGLGQNLAFVIDENPRMRRRYETRRDCGQGCLNPIIGSAGLGVALIDKWNAKRFSLVARCANDFIRRIDVYWERHTLAGKGWDCDRIARAGKEKCPL